MGYGDRQRGPWAEYRVPHKGNTGVRKGLNVGCLLGLLRQPPLPC